MTRTRARLITWIVLEVLFIALIFIGAVYDYDISSALSGVSVANGVLVSNVGFIPKALEAIGEWPALVLVAYSLCVIVRNLRKLAKKTSILFMLGVLDIGVVATMLYGWHATFEDILGDGNIKGWHYIIIVVLALMFAYLIHRSVSLIPKKVLKSFFVPAVITVITAASALVCVEVIKICWGRVRMREIVAANDPTLFTSWFVPNWFSGSKSFPSGHTAYSTLLFIIPIWFAPSKSDKKRRITYAVVGAWVAILAFSRLCAAAHYLSDVTFGFAISFIIVQIATIKFEKSFKGRPEPAFIRTRGMGSTTTVVSVPPIQTAKRPVFDQAAGKERKSNIRGCNPAPVSTAQNSLFEPEAPSTSTVNQQNQSARRAAIPAKETRPLNQPTANPTSFSLDRARAEKAQHQARAAEAAEAEARKLEEGLKLAVTGEFGKFRDISVPVIPKSAEKPKPKRKTSSQPRKKSAPKDDSNAVQMHFRYDSASNNLTSDISDD